MDQLLHHLGNPTISLPFSNAKPVSVAYPQDRFSLDGPAVAPEPACRYAHGVLHKDAKSPLRVPEQRLQSVVTDSLSTRPRAEVCGTRCFRKDKHGPAVVLTCGGRGRSSATSRRFWR